MFETGNTLNQSQRPVSQEQDTELCFEDRYRGLETCIKNQEELMRMFAEFMAEMREYCQTSPPS